MFQLVKDNALTAKQKLGHTCTCCTYSGELFSLVWKASISKNLQGLYWRNAIRQFADKKKVLSHLSFLIVSKRLEMPAVI